MRAGKRRAVRPREPTLRHLLVSTWEVTRVSVCFTCVGRRARAEVGRGRRGGSCFFLGKISFWIGAQPPDVSHQPNPALAVWLETLLSFARFSNFFRVRCRRGPATTRTRCFRCATRSERRSRDLEDTMTVASD